MSSTRLLVLIGLIAAGCGTEKATTEDGAPFEVSEDEISHETSQAISVWSPTVDGSWPVAFVLHGMGGTRQGIAPLAKAVAAEGHVVFVPDVRTTGSHLDAEQDSECAYRYMISVAEQHGGDLGQPITGIGHSLGAQTILTGGLDEAKYGPNGTYDTCLNGVRRPDALVSIAGCHYEYLYNRWDFDPARTGWANDDAAITLIVGSDDETCPPWQSQDATDALVNAGYDAVFVQVDAGTHATVIFEEIVNDEWVPAPDSAAGTESMDAILNTIERARAAPSTAALRAEAVDAGPGSRRSADGAQVCTSMSTAKRPASSSGMTSLLEFREARTTSWRPGY